MSTYREIVYMILDEIKGESDDFTYNEDHVLFLMNKYRALVLSQKYENMKRQVNPANLQTLCIDLQRYYPIEGDECNAGVMLRSTKQLPFSVMYSTPRVYPQNFLLGDISFVSQERLKYIGHSRYLKNIMYASIGQDNYLYIKSSNPQFLNMTSVKISAIFEDASKAAELSCSGSGGNECSIMDVQFPLEEGLIQTMIQLCDKELLQDSFNPEDRNNNAQDDAANLTQYIARNMKNETQKKIEGNA